MDLSRNRRVVLTLATGGLLTLVIVLLAIRPLRAAGPWYVAPGGDDGNDCLSPGAPCATINGAIGKAGPGDTIYVAVGTYTGAGDQVVLLDKDLTLSGGWDEAFTAQGGISTIDGEGARRGMTVAFGITAVVERFAFQSGNGGGIYNDCGSPGHLTLNDSTISGNTSDGHGGGIYNGGTLTLNNSTVSGNIANGFGGGIRNYYAAVTLNNSTVSGNTAGEYGGGIYNSQGAVTINNSTISGSTAWQGGGIFNRQGTLTLNSSTVSANTATFSGGGMYVWEGTVTLRNSILGGNTAASGLDCSGTSIGSAGYNLVGTTSGCTFSASTGDLTGVDASLGLLIGSPGYFPLLSGSPAIDAGNPDGCSGSTGLLTTDQRGATRVGRCDIGSYEYTVPGPAASIYAFGGTPQTAPPSVAFRTPLQAAVLDGIGSPVDSATVSFLAPASGTSGTFADSGTSSTSAVTNETGVATAAIFTANELTGSYTVTAAVAGVVTPASFSLGNLAWYVSPSGDDVNDCQTPATSCATISGALNKPSFAAGDTVLVATGVYTGTGDQVVLLDRDAILSGGWDAGFTTQSGASTIDGQGERRGMTVRSGTTAVVERFAVQNGNGGYTGGGIRNDGALTLNHCTVEGCTTRNEEFYARGGGIDNNGTATLNSSTVSGNVSAMSGGGIFSSQGTLTLNDSVISGNAANSGGGVYNSIGTVILQNSVLRENSASLGGGIYTNGGTTTLNHSAISGNWANSNGGGIYDDAGTLTLINSTVSDNTASGSGGGISNEAGLDAGTMILSNSTVSGNTANEYCGGIFNGGTLTLNNCTVSGNTAGISRGGICELNTNTTLQNSILGDNKAGSAPDCFGTIGSAGYNIVGNTAGCTFGATSDDLTNVDPILGSLEGSPAYHPLLPDSPAVHGGNPAGCTDDEGNPLPTDQRGFPRFGRCDIGAYELQPIGFSTLTADPSVALPSDTLTYTLALKNPGATEIANVRVTDTLPISLSYIEGSLTATSGTYGHDSGEITWTGSVGASSVVTISWAATISPLASYNTSITNSAVISGAGEIITRTAIVSVPPFYVYLPLCSRYYCPDFIDDFSNPASGWEVVDDSYVRAEYLDGEYRVLTKQSGYFYLFRAPSCTRQNYTVEADARWAGTPGSLYGLIFGLASDYSRYYLFVVNTDYQQFLLLRRDPTEFVIVVPATDAPAINGGTASNHLRVTRYGTEITLEVNGTVLGTWYDGTIGGLTGAGLLTNPYLDLPVSDARFDNFAMITLPGDGAPVPESGSVTPDEIEFVAPNARRDLVPLDMGW